MQELPVPFGMWDFAQARLIRIQNSVKRLKFSKVGVKKDPEPERNWRRQKKKTGEEKRTEKKKFWLGLAFFDIAICCIDC
jgi:hypothetical protein